MDKLKLSFPTKVVSYSNITTILPALVSEYGNKVLLVTSRQLFPASDIIDKMYKSLTDRNINVLLYDEVTPSSDSSVVDKVAALAKSARCDFVIGMGGDIVLNIAKAIALLCSNPGESADYLTEQHGYRLHIGRSPLPTILIPTTFGTLCEVNPGFIIKDQDDGVRKKLYSEMVRPSLTILDPYLTGNVSKKYIAASGLMILAYAIDLYVSTKSNVMSDTFAEKAIELVNQNLQKLVKEPENMDLRGHLLTASLMVSYGASCGGLGAIYALSETFASVSDIYKGSVASLMLPQFMEFNLTTSSAKYVHIAKALDEDISDISVLEAGIKAVERVRIFVEEYNIPSKLTDLGFEEERVGDVWTIFSRFEESKQLVRPITEDDLGTIIEQSL